MKMLICSISGAIALWIGLVVALRQPDDTAAPSRAKPTIAQRAGAPASGAPPELRASAPATSPTSVAEATPAADPRTARAARLSQAERRKLMLDRLRQSGRGSEPWMPRVGETLTAWRDLAPELAARVTAGPIDCFHDGCSVELTSADLGAFNQLNESLPTSRGFVDFPGWRFRIGSATHDDGSIVSTWFFMRPDGPAAERE